MRLRNWQSLRGAQAPWQSSGQLVRSFGTCFGLTMLLAISTEGLAQTPGYRMRVPATPLGLTGASVRPPRLTGTSPSTVHPAGRRVVDLFRYFPWYPAASSDYAYPDDSTGDYSTETEPVHEIFPVYDSAPDVGRLQVSLERVRSRTMVRLSWQDRGLGAAQVAFFLADTRRAVLAAQTVRSPPFTALFEPPPGTAFTGMTVVLPGGTLVTQFLPYRRWAQ